MQLLQHYMSICRTGSNLWQCALMVTYNAPQGGHLSTGTMCQEIPLSHIILILSEPDLALSY